MAKRSRRSGLLMMSTKDLHKELVRRERKIATMLRRRNRLVVKLDRMDQVIHEMGGAIHRGGRVGAIPGRKRPQNETNLAEALVKVLKGKTMGVTEVAGAVQKAGYKTGAANFRTIVNQALIKNRNLFKKVDRGQYTAA